MANHTVYAVASGKGGVGKTVTSVNLGAALAARGNAVVVVDVDLGMANLGGFLGVGDDGPTLHEVLAGETALESAVYEVDDRLAAVPSGVSLDGFAGVDTDELSAAVDALSSAFDYVILDLGAGLSHDTVLPLALADAVMLVSTDDAVSLGDTNKTRQITERLGTPVGGLLLTRTGPPGGVDVDGASDAVGMPVLAVVPEDDAVDRAAAESMPVVAFDPDSPAARAYEGLADIVVEESLADAPVLPSVPAERTPAATTPDEPTVAGEEAPANASADPEEETATDPERATDPEGETTAGPEAGTTADPEGGTASPPAEPTPADGAATVDADAGSAGPAEPTDESARSGDAAADEVDEADGVSLAAEAVDDGDDEAVNAGAAETPAGEAPTQPGAGPQRAEEAAESTAEEIAAAIEAASDDDGDEEAPRLSVEGADGGDEDESGGLLSRFFG